MREIFIPNQELIYIDMPNNEEALERYRVQYIMNPDNVPPIIVVEPSKREWYTVMGGKYAILDGSHRAYVASEHNRRVRANLVETNQDLESIKHQLESEHNLLKLDIKTLDDLFDNLSKSIMASRGVDYTLLNFGKSVD